MAFPVLPAVFVGVSLARLFLSARARRSLAADSKNTYRPKSASYGQVVPLAYGTNLLPAPAIVRGRLEVNDYVWEQHSLALMLCQGPISAVQAVWLSDGSANEIDKSTRVEWARLAACGMTLQAGTLTGNAETTPAFTQDGSGDVTCSLDGAFGDPVRAVGRIKIAAESPRSFLPLFLGATSINLADCAYVGFSTNARLDGDYTVTSISDKEIVLVIPQTSEGGGWWSQMDAGVDYTPYSSFVIASNAGGFHYPGIAYLRGDPLNLAELYRTLPPEETKTPSYQAEASTFLATGAAAPDAEAVDVLADLFGTNYWAANAGIVVDGDVGTDGQAASSARTYCRAMGFHVSGYMDEQRPASEHGQDVLDAVDCVAVESEGKWKILPAGSVAVTANGASYVPNSTPVYALGPSDLRGGTDEPMIRMSALSDSLAVNVVPVEYRNRTASGAPYRVAIETAFDPADIDIQADLTGGTGKRESSPVVLHWIATPEHARRIAQLRLQRSLAIKNAQAIRLGWNKILVDGMDLLTLTDPGLDLDAYPVRVSSVSGDLDGNIDVETIDWPEMATAPRYSTQSSDAPASPAAADPGAVDAPIVLPVPAYLSGADPEVWIATSGSSTAYGGCEVYVSTDDVAYSRVGRIEGRSAFGYLTAQLLTGSALDDTHDLLVDLVRTRGILGGTSAAGRDALETLCYVDGELLAYKDATPGAGAYTYTLESLRRGAYETTIATHAAGSTFVRLDSHVLRVALPASFFGTAIYLKCVPFNLGGGGSPALADVTATTVTLTRPTALAPTACSIGVTSTPPSAAANQWRETAQENLHLRYARVQWTVDAGSLATGWDVVIYTGTDPDATQAYVDAQGVLPANVRDAVFAVSAAASPLTVRASVRARFDGGTVSAWRNSSGTATIDANTSAAAGGAAEALDTANDALTLAGSKARVYYQAAAPAGLTSDDAGDLWFNTDTTTNCPDSACTGHTLDTAGVPRTGTYPHRGVYWPHRWDDVALAWKDAMRTAPVAITEYASSIRPVAIVGALPTLPATAYPVGSTCVLTTDGKMYRNVADAWVRTLPASDLAGQITGVQIADDAVTAAKIAANTITAGEIAANTITAGQIAADTITGGQIAAGAISATEIASRTITADRIGTGVITATEIASHTITANQIAATTITASELAAGAVVADKIAANVVATSHLTTPSSGNLFPNATSETPPPTGADTSTAEWAGRSAAVGGVTPYAGSYMRAFHLIDPAGPTTAEITHSIPCMAGEVFSLAARTNAAGSPETYVGLLFYSSGSGGSPSQTTESTAGPGSAWGVQSVTATAPTGAQRVTFRLRAVLNDEGTDGYACFDAIEARRMVDAAIIVDGALKTSNYAEDGSGYATAGVKLDHTGTALKAAVSGVRFGPTLFSDLWSWGWQRCNVASSYANPGTGSYRLLSTFTNNTRSAYFVRGVVATGSTGQALKVTAAGNYLVQWGGNFSDSIGLVNFVVAVAKNGSVDTNTLSYTYAGSGGRYYHLGGTYMLTLAANDEIELAWNVSGTSTWTFQNVEMIVTRLPD